MGKFNTTATTGGPSVLDTASVALPVAPTPEAEAAPAAPAQAGGSVLDSIVAEATPEQALEGVGEAVGAVAEQELVDQVPSLKQRQEAGDTGRYDFMGLHAEKEAQARQAAAARVANNQYHSDGGMNQRAKNMEASLHDKALPGIQSLGSRGQGPVKTGLEKMGMIDPAGTWTPQAGVLMSAVTENFIADRSFGKDIEIPEGQVAEAAKNPEAFTKNIGRAQLGRDIAAEQARMQGRPTPDLTEEEAVAVGDMAQELYYEVNKEQDGEQFMIRTEVGDGENKQTAFQITQKGSDLLTLGAAKRKRLFPKQHVRTQKTPLGGPTQSAREYTRQVSSKAGQHKVNSREQREALRNLNEVANVVDGRRNKILLAVALNALRGKPVFDNEVLFISDKDLEGTTDNLAQDIFGIQLEKDAANYLTYYTQDFNGRMAPQQTTLDPTASKAARFVTRNAIPADTSSPRIKRNLIQMYSMHLVPDEYSGLKKPSGKPVSVDQMMPAERAKVMQNPALQKRLAGWGAQLKAAFNQIPDAAVDQVSEAIKAKQPVQQLAELPVPELSPDLVEFINSKGEDGLMVIDGLIDYHDFMQAETKGKPHQSYFNATMDGKTNGIASNGIQMGSENVARKTGVITSKDQNVQILDNGVDIRDDLELVLKGLIDQGFDGKFNDNEITAVRQVAADIAGDRSFNKKITMTFGYGKEIGSFKNEIAAMVDEHPAAAGLDSKEVTDAIFNNYIPAMEQVMDEDALAARSVMRSATWIAAWYNELFQMDAPLEGQKISLGATVGTGYAGELARSGIFAEGKGRDVSITAPEGREATSAAEKAYPPKEEGGEIQKVAGDVAYGGSIPGPVQSLDAATVVKTVTGNSWKRLRNASKGHPYIHTVYDAFKTDANGFDVVLEETNKNWLNLNMDWSYLHSMAAATKEARDRGKKKFADRPDNSPLTDNESLMLRQWIVTNKDGELKALEDRFKNLLIDPGSAQGAAQNVKDAMVAAGYRANATPTVGQLKAAIAAIEKELNVDARLAGFARKTDAKKEELKKTIRSLAPSPKETLGYDLRYGAQYYAH